MSRKNLSSYFITKYLHHFRVWALPLGLGRFMTPIRNLTKRFVAINISRCLANYLLHDTKVLNEKPINFLWYYTTEPLTQMINVFAPVKFHKSIRGNKLEKLINYL